MGVDPLLFARSLKYYKRPEVQIAIARHSLNREVSVRYGPDSFGKRPDMLAYPGDVLAFAKKKVTSFHCSEERWRDALNIVTGMRRAELDNLRLGWDLVLDIDCPYWEYAKLTAYLFIKALQDHGVSGISVKFSGNKGFHIGVPFEAFPSEYDNKLTKDLFPDAPRAIAQYLLDYIETHYITVRENIVSFADKKKISFQELQKQVNQDLLIMTCPDCKKPRKEKKKSFKYHFVCANCQHRDDGNVEYMKCAECGSIMEQFEAKRSGCPECGSDQPSIQKFNVQALIEVDTILLASRHLYRMAYSLHEKSNLVSVPFAPEHVLAFEKSEAEQDVVDYTKFFLDPASVRRGEGADLLAKALIFQTLQDQSALEERKQYAAPEEAIGDEFFPPCIKRMLQGLVDGKKRALFIFTNFFRSCGWTPEMIKDRMYEWNEVNPEPLRETVLKGHLSLKAKASETIMPPNCNSDYYSALGVCMPDDFCRTIKNPAQYALKKWRMANFRKDGAKKAKRTPLTEEQLNMRRAHRAKLKEEKDAQEKNTEKEIEKK